MGNQKTFRDKGVGVRGESDVVATVYWSDTVVHPETVLEIL